VLTSKVRNERRAPGQGDCPRHSGLQKLNSV